MSNPFYFLLFTTLNNNLRATLACSGGPTKSFGVALGALTGHSRVKMFFFATQVYLGPLKLVLLWL